MQKLASIEQVWQRKYPEQVVLALTVNEQNQVNIMTIGWVAVVSDEPPMYMLGIDDNAYTLELIRQNKEFVIAFPAKTMAGAALFCGTVHGHKIDKGRECGLNFAPGSKINVPILADAVANLECRLVTEYRPGNCPLIIGEVVAGHVNCDENVQRLINAGPGYLLQ